MGKFFGMAVVMFLFANASFADPPHKHHRSHHHHHHRHHHAVNH
jgi:hypothetical protein